jgi:hypothetical protein
VVEEEVAAGPDQDKCYHFSTGSSGSGSGSYPISLGAIDSAGDSNGTTSIADLLDGTLRSLAVLDSQLFQVLVREAVDEAVRAGGIAPPSSTSSSTEGDESGGRYRLSEIYSGLLDHGEMMAEFEKMKL